MVESVDMVVESIAIALSIVYCGDSPYTEQWRREHLAAAPKESKRN